MKGEIIKKPMAKIPLALLCSLLIPCVISIAQASQTPREVTITFFVDDKLLESGMEETTKAKISEQVKFISGVFTREFGIAFAIRSIKPFKFPPDAVEIDAGGFLSSVKTAGADDDSDIFLGFTQRKLYACLLKEREESSEQDKECPPDTRKVEVAGYAERTGRVGVISGNSLAISTKFTFLHEVSHMFGAEDQEESIMTIPIIPTQKFDAKNRSIILSNRERIFKKPTSPK